jgi:hypothetical protein
MISEMKRPSTDPGLIKKDVKERVSKVVTRGFCLNPTLINM